jgi:SAM-dependent methyltransferase
MKTGEEKQSHEWFQDWFDEHYLTVYSHRTSVEADRFTDLWPVWENMPALDSTGVGWCIDIGCGTGRYTQAVARRGLHVLGVDLSRVLLKQAVTVTPRQCDTYFVRADMRSLPTKGPFVMALSLFTSFGYFGSDEEHFKLLNDIQSILIPGGFIVIDLPNCASVVQRVRLEPDSERQVDDYHIRERRSIEDDGRRVVKRITINTGKEQREYFESVRLFTQTEMKSMLNESGFRLLQAPWGDYNGTPLAESSARMIFFGVRDG